MLKEKRWIKESEKPIYEEWKKNDSYRFEDSHKPVFSIDTPPPYVNTPIHIGHAVTYTLMDMFARFRRMHGCNVLFPLGLDRNGLPIEVATEKRFGVSIAETSREEFIEFCKKLLEEASEESVDSFLKLGISFNSWSLEQGIGDMYFTDSKEYRTLTQSTFIELWNRGLIYEDERINNYCPGCRTTLADAEVEYEERPALFNEIIFRVKETGEDIVIGTTRPELICTCGMVIYNPDDERYKHLKNKIAITPAFGKEVPIKPHAMAEPEKGTGLVMMCSAGDQSDIRFFREMDLEPAIAINADGKMNAHAGFLNGLSVKDAREKILVQLKNSGLLVSQKRIMHRTPVCERSKDEVEFIAMPEFYLKQIGIKEEMKKLAETVNFYSPKSRQILIDWINAISIDWPISRRRYYATEIPLWYCGCGQVIVPPKGYYYQPWRESPPIKKCPKCGSTNFRGEERVFDTWFDSANSPLYIMKWSDGEFFRKHQPCSLRPQGREIIRTWLYYTLLKAYLLTGKAIFSDVWINYYVVDENGRKMSKSLGNVIDPHEVIEKFGAEPFRLWTAVEGDITEQDFRCSFERIEGAGKTLTKLWNVARYVSGFDVNRLVIKKVGEKVEPEELDAGMLNITLTDLDKWIIKELDVLVKYTEEHYDKYNFHKPSIRIRHFIWETFASHYIEMSKNRAYNEKKMFSDFEQRSAIFTLHYCLHTILKLLAPVIPFITYRIYNDLYKRDIHKERFPKAMIAEDVNLSAEDINELDYAVWKAKKDKSVSLKAAVKELVLPEKFAKIEKDIVATHNVQKIKYGSHIEVVL